MQGSINFNNPNTIWHMGWGMGIYFLIHPKGWINDEWLAVHCLESVSIRLYIPSVLEISLGPCDVDDPRDISWASGNLLIFGAVQVYNPIHPSSGQCSRDTTFFHTINRQILPRGSRTCWRSDVPLKYGGSKRFGGHAPIHPPNF